MLILEAWPNRLDMVLKKKGLNQGRREVEQIDAPQYKRVILALIC